MIALRSAPTDRTEKTETNETYPTNGQFIFSNFGVGGGKNRLVKTKLHLVARAVLATIIFSTPVLFAGSDYDLSKETPPPPPQPWCETPQTLEIRIGAPGWMAGVSGNSGIKGVVTSPDVSFDQILTHLTHVPIPLSVDIRYQRWEFFGDGLYMDVGASASLPGLLFTNANVHLQVGLAEGFVGYRVINCDKASLSLFAGARYSYQGGDLSIFNNGDARLVILRRLLGIRNRLDFSDSTGWVDPVIGAHGKVKIWRATSLYAEADVGGFDANSSSAFEIRREGRTIAREPVDSSDWSYQVQGGLEFQISRWFWAQVGWRYLKYDYNQGGFTNKTALNGPQVMGGINF
jgi:opacity protein-like surface antigen